MENFTVEEIQMMLKAIDALEAKEANDMLIEGMLGAVFARTSEESKEVVNKVKNDFMNNEEKRSTERERLTIVRAKLITAKQEKLNKMLNQ